MGCPPPEILGDRPPSPGSPPKSPPVGQSGTCRFVRECCILPCQISVCCKFGCTCCSYRYGRNIRCPLGLGQYFGVPSVPSLLDTPGLRSRHIIS